MKKHIQIHIILVLLFSLILLNLKAQELVSIKGNIPDFAGQKIKLQFFATPFQNGPDQAEIPLNNEGNCSFQIQIFEAQNLNLYVGNELIRFYVKPGDTLTFQSIQKGNGRQQQFSGSGANDASWYQIQKEHFQNNFENADYSAKLIQEMTQRSQDQYKNYLDSVVNLKITFLKQNSKKLSKEFVIWQTAEIKYEFESFKINYPNWYYSMRGIENKVLEVDSNYFAYLKKTSINQEDIWVQPIIVIG